MKFIKGILIDYHQSFSIHPQYTQKHGMLMETFLLHDFLGKKTFAIKFIELSVSSEVLLEFNNL